jgi:predicted nucleotide-binding protein
VAQRRKKFDRTRFSPVIYRNALAVAEDVYGEYVRNYVRELERKKVTPIEWKFHILNSSYSVNLGEDEWSYDTLDEFFAAIQRDHVASSFYAHISMPVPAMDPASGIQFRTEEFILSVEFRGYQSVVSVTFTSIPVIERVMSHFSEAEFEHRLPEPDIPPPPTARVFIGHGGASDQWRDLKDHLHDVHGYEVVAFETGSRAGHTIRDILVEMLEGSTFAILVMTAEDEQKDETMRARQNVVHEAGLFQGRLGFSKTVILLENGTTNFSNLDGIQYVPFSPGNIRETFGDVLGAIRREFSSAI